jgi:type IX secretion system substrate protein
MKKFLLFIYLFVLMPMQAQVIFQEDFDGIAGPTAGGAGTYSFPAGWLLRNVDNRTPAVPVSYINEAWERREDFNFSVIDSCAFSTSFYAPAGASDDWMWTPPIVLPATTSDIRLDWNAVTYDPAFPDGYEVRIMASPNTPTGGTGVLGNQVTASQLLLSVPAENTVWTARTANLNMFNGQTVRIAFRNNSTDKFLLLIDDVKVTVVAPMAEIQEALLSEYTRIPRNQYEPPLFSAKITNVGIPAFDASVRLRIYDPSSALVMTSISPPVSLLAGQVSGQLPAAAAFQPAVTGTYTFSYDVIIDGTEDAISPEVSYTIMFTDSEMARDDDILTGALGIGAGNGGYLGQSFEITHDISLSLVDIFTTGNTELLDVEMGCAVFKLVGGVPQLLFTAPSQQIPGLAPAAWMQYAVDPPLDLLAGDTIVVCAQEFAQTISVALSDTIFTPGTTYVNWPTSPFPGWAHNEDFGMSFAKSYMIRPQLSCLMEDPVVTSPQEFCDAATVANLSATGDSIEWFEDAVGGLALTTGTALISDTYYVTQSLGFCKSLRVPVVVTVTPSTTNTTTIAACGSYTWTVNGVEYTDTGIYTVTDGCHTETLDLTITPITTNTTTLHACDGYTWPVNGVEYTEAGTYSYVDGCHTEILELTFTTSTTNTTAIAACDSYNWAANGQEYTASGTYSVTDNCHTEILELTITPSTMNSTTLMTCGSYIWPVTGQEYTSTGIYEFIDGCHTETLGLTVNPNTTNTTVISACDTYNWAVNGQEYTESGSYDYVSGCDTETLELTITSSVSINTQPMDQIIEEGNLTVFTVAASGPVSWQWQSSTDNGGNWNDIPEGSGYTGTQTNTLTIDAATVTMALNGLEVQAIAENGSCPDLTTDTATLTVTLDTAGLDLKGFQLYPNPTSSAVYIQMDGQDPGTVAVFDSNGRHIKSQTIEDVKTMVNLSDIAAGVYVFRITTAKGTVNRKVIRL